MLLHKLLPADVIADVKDILRKGQATAGATPYKDLKTRIQTTFGKTPEDAYYAAKAMVMVGKPSQLAKKLINTLCKDHPNLEGCCQAGTISGMWRDQLPSQVRAQVANMSLVGTVAQQHTLDTADKVFATLSAGARNAVNVAAAKLADLDTSADAPALQQVAAASRPPPKKKPAGKPQPKPGRGNPHPDGPPPQACNTHWKYGKSAFKCRKPGSCPWEHYSNPKPQ